LTLGDFKLTHLPLTTSAHHENIASLIIVFITVLLVITVLAIIEDHAFWLRLTAEHRSFHVGLLLVSLRLHLLQEIFSIRLFENISSLFFIFVRFEEDSTENFSGDSLMETIGNKFGKLVKLLLLILRMLRFLNESNDFFLDLLWKIQMIHGRVDRVDLFLQDDCLFVDVVHKHGQLAEQVGLRNCTHDVCDRDEHELFIVSRAQIISEEEEAAGVEADAIFVRVRLVKEGASVVPAPDVVEGRDPLLLPVNDVEPNAGNEVNVHEQEENELH
jgi:hypothetical protein